MPSTVSVQPKSGFASKTTILNAAFFVVGAIAIANEFIVATTDLVSIPSEVTRWLLVVNTAANIVVRRFTEQPIRFMAPETKAVEVPASEPGARAD